MKTEKLAWLAYGASLEMLVLLLDEERFISSFYRSATNPEGIGSSSTVIRTRNHLVRRGLVEEYEGERGLGGTRIYLRLTEKGREVAEHLKKVLEALQE